MSGAGPVLHHRLYIRMISDHNEWRQVSPEDIGALLAHNGHSVGLVLHPLLSFAVRLRRLPRNLTKSKTDSEDLDLVIGCTVMKTHWQTLTPEVEGWGAGMEVM